MKNLFSTTAILAALTTASAVNAQGLSGDWYVSVFGGFSTASDAEYDATDRYEGYDEVIFVSELESGLLFGIAVGTQIAPNLRAETEISYAEYEIGEYSVEYSPGDPGSDSYGDVDGDVSATYLLANLWYDLNDVGAGGFTPYVGGGIGAVTVEGEGDPETTGAFQVGAGASVPVGAGMIDIGYRFKLTGEIEFENGEVAPISSNNLQVGYRISF